MHFPYRGAALAWVVIPLKKCLLPATKEASLSAPWLPEFSVWGTVGYPFFLFCSDLDSRYVLSLMSFGARSPQACLKRMLHEMQTDGGRWGAGRA